MKIALHQMTSGIDLQSNVEIMIKAIGEASKNGAKTYFAPEMSLYLDKNRKRAQQNIKKASNHPALKQLCKAAKECGIEVHLGSMPIAHEGNTHAPYVNRSYIIDNEGKIQNHYDKIHLFDVALSTGEHWQESNSYKAGNKAVVANSIIGPMGLSICYDLRFASLYNILTQAGAQITAVPAAFTIPTGEAHWHVLLRARAIENTMFIVAAAQCGHHEDGRHTYGHSLVVDPWGEILLDMEQEIGLGYVDIDIDRLNEVRSQLPVLQHRRDIPKLI